MIFERAKRKYGAKTGNIVGETIRAERPFIQMEVGLIEYFDGNGTRMYKTTDGKKQFVADIYDKTFKTEKLKILPNKIGIIIPGVSTDGNGVRVRNSSSRAPIKERRSRRIN